MKLSDKVIRRLILAGLSAVCVVLVIAIYSQFKVEQPEDVVIQPAPTVSDEVNPSLDTPTTPDVFVKEPSVIVPPIVVPETPAHTNDTGDSSGTEQSIQKEPVKPAAPTEKPKPKPGTESKSPSKSPEYKPEDTVKTQPNEPVADQKNDKGQMWFPGFGWVDVEGPNKETRVDGEGDINKAVGSMD